VLATVVQSLIVFGLPRWIVAVLVGVGVIGASAWYVFVYPHPDSGPTIARVGSPAPNVSLIALDGGSHDLSQDRGKVVLLNFWATWCIPCRTEMPELQGLADDLQGESFAMLTIDLQEDVATIGPFRRELGLRLPVLLDEEGNVTRSYGVRALPATFLIDRNGILRQQRLGPLSPGGAETPWSRSWIAERVRTLLQSE
jgi:cytochrome c biogenesis protein CcmG, thiol:disulfide interchange protein DsbE